MFNLGQYLHQLLYTHQEVGVPGIGIFSKERVAARYDESTQSYLPPAFRYVLRPHAPTDSILIEEVASRQQITFDEASHQIDAAVDQLRNHITTHGEVQLDQIGYLKETEGTYTLIAFDPVPYWGLTAVTNPIKTATEAVAEPISVPTTPEAVPVGEEDLIEPAPQKSSLWIWMVVLLCILGVGAFWYIRYYNQNAPVQSVAQPSRLDSTQAAVQAMRTDTVPDSTKQAVILPPDSSIAQAPPSSEGPLVQQYSKTHPYCIVLASFKTMDFAIKQAEYFRSTGIAAYVLESNMPNNRKKICYGRYVTAEEAKADLAKVRKEISEEAYIYPSE